MPALQYHANLAIVLVAAIAVSCFTGCAKPDPDYYPLAAGSWWHYQIQTTLLDKPQEQRLVVANLGAGNYADHRVFIQRQSNGREVYFQLGPRNLERIGIRAKFGDPQPLPQPLILLPRRPTSDDNWLVDSELKLAESRTFARQDKLRNLTLPIELSMSVTAMDATIEVPAGRFKACLRVDGIGRRNVRTDRGNASAEILVTQSEWYAPSIGLVKSIRQETSDSPFLKSGYYEQSLLQFGR